MRIILTKQERAELIKQHGGVCDHCHKKHAHLHAHHSDYTKKPDVVLCPQCHSILHHEPDAPKASSTGTATNILRLPKSLYRRIVAEAKRQKRSANAVMVIVLNDYIERRDLDRRWAEGATEGSVSRGRRSVSF